jgi:hypothetical protein
MKLVYATRSLSYAMPCIGREKEPRIRLRNDQRIHWAAEPELSTPRDLDSSELTEDFLADGCECHHKHDIYFMSEFCNV